MANSIRTGAAALSSRQSTSTPPTNGASGAFNARVTFVLYDETDKERFKKYGGYEGIGTIECMPLQHELQPAAEPIVARPVHTNHRKFPLINEIVEIVPAASIQAQNAKGSLKVSYYYTHVVGIWDSPEHNATPDVSYLQHNKPVTGERFEEKGSVRKLMHSPGDITYESRFGSSIRMGGSHNSMKYTPWKGDNGKPVLVIMNGQKQTKEEGWLPTFEDINGDGSSIYMLSGHKIPFVPANVNFASHNQTVSTTDKSKYILGSKTKIDETKTAADVDTANTAIVPNNTFGATVPTGRAADSSSPAEEEINFLPEYESDSFYQELEDILLGEDDAKDLPARTLNFGVNIKTYNNNKFADGKSLRSGIQKGSYKNLPILNYKPTYTPISQLTALIISLQRQYGFPKNTARSVLAIAINEQGRGAVVTGGHFNHYGITTDGSVWDKGTYNISFTGQYMCAPSTRIYAAFANEKDSVLFMVAALQRPNKNFQSIPDNNDAYEFAVKYITLWYSVPVTQSLLKEKMYGYNQAKKLIP